MLKEMDESQGARSSRMAGTELVFSKAKPIVGSGKDREYSLKMPQFPGEAPAASGQRRDIMAQVGIDTLHSERVILIVDIVNMRSRIDYVQVPDIPVRAVCFGLRSRVHDLLDHPGGLDLAYRVPHDLPWAAAHHRHDIDVLTGFCPGLPLQKPVQLIQFHNTG